MIKKKVNVIITMIIEYAGICLTKQDSEYASFINLPKFWTWQSSENEYGRVLNMLALCSVLSILEYAQTVLNIFQVLNMPGFWICNTQSYTGF